ncbi:MAG TPA: transcriptional repressor [Polyangiaceae bacterium]|nr:transcriptional repressor [Polyangiaceae bacterium]
MSKSQRAAIRQSLQDAGLRVTAPRVAVLELLGRAGHPLSHREVVDGLGEVDWDRATVFRNLQKLVETGLAEVSSRAGGIARYELMRDREPAAHLHPHFACRDCGTVSCLHDSSLTAPSDPGWREAVLDADLQVVGRCPDCRRSSSASKKKPARSVAAG